MEVQMISFAANDGEVLPKIMGVIHTRAGPAVLFTAETSIECFTDVRDEINKTIAKMQSERAMLKAMVPPAGLQ